MAVSGKKCLGVDFGADTIRVAVMERAKGGPRVLNLLETRVPLEPDLTEAQVIQRKVGALDEMLKKAKVGNVRNAVFCVPGQTVIIKRIRLPKADPERLARMISFEARQQIPFPIEKTILEYQVFEEPDSEEVHVLIAAIKREFISNFMRLVGRTRLSTSAISVSSLALYNFHELNTTSRDLTLTAKDLKKIQKRKEAEEKKAKSAAKKKGKAGGLMGKLKSGKNAPEAAAEGEAPEEEAPLESMGFEEIQAFVNMGHKVMDLAIPKPGQVSMIGFPRSVPLGGDNIDRKIADRLGLQDIAEARRVKEERAGIISMEYEMEAESEGLDQQASEAATEVAERLVAEIRRSLDYYISQPDGVAVDSLVLSGGLARMRYLTSFVEEKLGLPITLAEPRNENLRMPEKLPEPFHPFTIAIGLGAQGLGLAQHTINFLPEDQKVAQEFTRKPWILFMMIGILLAIIGMGWNVGSGKIQAMKRVIEESQATMQRVQQDDKVIADAVAKDAQVLEAYNKLSRAAADRAFWLDFMRQFQENRPSDVLIDELHLRADGNVLVRGKSPRQSSVTQFLSQLKTLELIDAGEITRITQEYDQRFGTNVPIWSFDLSMKTHNRQARVRTIGVQPKSLEEINAPANTRRGEQPV